MANLKTIIKSKTFFIYSILMHIFISLILVLVSWQIFEPNTYNFMIQNFAAQKVGSEQIAIIVIDDKSVQRHRWPWSRDLYAKFFEYLHYYGKPKIIGYDSLLSSKDNKVTDEKLFSMIKKLDNIVVGFGPLSSDDVDERYIKKFNNKFKISVEDKRTKKYPTIYNDVAKYPDAYFDAVKYTGSVNVRADYDGILKFGTPLIRIQNDYYPSLSLRMYLLLNNTNKVIIKNNEILIPATNTSIPAQSDIVGVHTPTKFYKHNNNSEYSYKKYSAIDIIDSLEQIKRGEKPIISPSEFKDKIVFVGANARAVGILEDIYKTPMLNTHPGVDVQATSFDNMLNNEFIHMTSLKFDIFLIALFSIITYIIVSRLSIFKSIITLVILAILYFIISAICFSKGIAPNVITPLVIQSSTMVFAYSYKFIIEGKNKEKIKNAMGKYLSQDIMQNVVQNIDNIKLGGKKANVTVLFADIRGFTSMSEKMTAEEVSVILNEYFSEIEPIISKYNGVINKFIGDAVMAIFGEPIQDINHPQNAVKCACAMLKKVEELQEKWLLEGKPKIEIGIGINTGEAFVGNIGSEKRLEYTVIGDTVNLASRIESYNKVYKTNLLISSSTYTNVSDIVNVIKIANVTIRGKAKKMDIYEVLGLN